LDALGVHTTKLARKGVFQMGNLMKYNAANLDQLMDRITRNSIGMDDYFDKIFKAQQESNYPPYNLVQLSNTESRLEVALAGFKKDEVVVYTEYGKLFIEGEKEVKEKEVETNFLHKGLAQRNFNRSWTISDDTEVRSVSFEDGLLTIMLGKVVPDHHARKNWL
jgi:HSP20 family molecular chaperone IbpA|tara:strand:+ start:129 stop:620 length:492 start_codon:yes stop_codon:yes gene_type:complete